LPAEARQLIPSQIEVEYNDTDQPMAKAELIRRDVASAAHETRIGMAMLAVRNCLAVLEGKPALTPVS